jgi:PRC-barrel domain
MDTLRSLAICAGAAAVLGLASVVSAQSPAPETPEAAPQAGVVTDTPQAATTVDMPKLVGMEVRSPTGQALGTVIDLVANKSGAPGYVVISTGADTATAVPYDAVSTRVREGKVIMDRTKLQNSPQVVQSDLHDKANTKWRQQADTYWAGQKADSNTERVRSASPAPEGSPQPKER